MSWAPCAFNGKLYAQRFQWPINVWWPQRFLWLINAWWSNNQRPLMKHSIHLHWPIKLNFFFRITLFILLILPMIQFPVHVSNSINIIYWPLFLLWTLIWPHFSSGSYHNLYASLTLEYWPDKPLQGADPNQTPGLLSVSTLGLLWVC